MEKKVKLKLPLFFKKVDSTEVLISGKLLTCIILSIISAFVDIVFFSGLSKSGYPFFGFEVSAAIILSLMSVGFSMAKFFFAMQITLTKELQNQLISYGCSWAKRLNRVKISFNIIHKFLITVSIITSLSLSVITIGNGVRRMEQNINNMTNDAQQLIDLRDSVKVSQADKTLAKKDTIFSTKNAQETTGTEVEKYYPIIEEWQQYNNSIEINSLTKEELAEHNSKRLSYVKKVPKVTSKNIDYISKIEFKNLLLKEAKEGEIVDSSKIYEESIAFDEQSIREQIIALADKDYKLPDGSQLVFIIDNEPINISLAISRLQKAIMDWQSDTGDAGASSKVFTLVATYLKADETAGGMGKSEWMMMFLIFLFGVIQEFIIAKLTPRPIITRKLLSQFNEYINWSEFDVDKFLLNVYDIYRKTNIITSEEFDHKAEKCVRLMNDNIENIKKRLLTENKKEIQQYSSKVTDAINELDEIIKEEK